MNRFAKRAALVTAAVLMVPFGNWTAWTQGAAITWTGGAGDSLVNTKGNWSTGAVPGGSDDAYFAGTTSLNPLVNVGTGAFPTWNPLDILFNAGAGAFTISPYTGTAGSSFGLLLGNTTPSGGNITNNSTNTQTFDIYVAPRAGTVSATSGPIVFNSFFGAGNLGYASVGQSGRGNAFAGANNIYLNGQISLPGFLNVNMTGGTLYITQDQNPVVGGVQQNNDFSGELTINTGAVQIDQAGALGLDPTDHTASDNDNPGFNTTTGSYSSTYSIVLMGGGADNGVLQLSDTDPNTNVASGGVTFFHKQITFNGRTAANAALDNVHGNNTWQGAITLQTSGNEYAIQSDAGSLNVTGAITNSTATATERQLYLQGAAGGNISGNITDAAGTTGVVDIYKAGAGTWTVSGTNSSIGSTNVTGGTLVYSSTAAMGGTTAFNLSNGATLDLSAIGTYTLGAAQPLSGIGTVKGSISTSSGTTITPGVSGTSGTLATTGDLNLTGGSVLNFGLTGTATSNGGTNNMLSVGGNLNLSGTTTININLLNTVLGGGTYDLINYAGSENGDLSDLSLMGLGSTTRQTFKLTNPTGQIDLVVSGNPANLSWVGGANSNTWDLKTTSNFLNLGTSGSDIYYDLDAVTFDDSGNAASPVNIAGTLTPASVTVNSSQNYTFAGSGSLTGAMTLTKSGTGSLTILTTNSYSGGTVINSGLVQVGNGTTSGSLGTGPITDNGSLVFNLPGTVSVPGNISGSGSITKQGSGEVDLSGASTYSGGTTISAGTLGAGGSTPLGTNGGGTTIASGARLLTLSTINIPGTITLSGNYDGAAGHGAIEASGGTATTGATATVTNLNLTGNTTLAADQYSALVVSGVIAGAGDNVNIVGGGTVDFAGANTYSGTTTVNSGVILQPNNASSLGTGTTGATVASGGETYATVNETLAYPFNVAGFGVGGTEAAPTVGAIRTGGSTTVTYSGPITLSADAGFYVDGGATMAVTGNVTGTNTNLVLSGAASSTGSITGNISLGTGGITDASGGNWIIAGTTTSFTGPLTINTGATLTVGNGATTGSIATASSITDNGTLAYNLSSAYAESHTISGSGGITQSGTGTTTLSGTNSFTGAVSITGGILQATNSSSLGTTSGVSLTGNGATSSLDLTGNSTIAAPLIMGGRALSATNTVPVEVTSEGNNTLTGAITLNTGGNAYGLVSNSGTLTVTGTFTNNTGTATERYVYLGGASNGLINGSSPFAIGTATGGPGIGLVKDGAGTWTLDLPNPNGLTGDVIIKQGTLAMTGFGPLGQGTLAYTDNTKSIATTITVYSGATYDLSGYDDPTGNTSSPGLQVLQQLVGTGTVKLAAGQSLRTFADNTIAPGISGAPGALTINGGVLLTEYGVSGDPAGNEPQGTILSFGLGATPSSPSDSLTVNGTLDIDTSVGSNIASVQIIPLGGSMAGTYTLVNATNITSAVQSDLSPLNSTRYNMLLNTSSTQVTVTISGSTGNDTWAGTAATWDVKTTPAWTGTPNGDNLFWTADTVNFTDAGSAQPTVTISGNVAPAAINVSANSTNYIFAGTGSIIGGTGINKSGTGMLTISTANTYSGVTTITNGVLQVNNATALGSSAGDTEVSGTGTLDVNNFTLGAESVQIAGNGFNGQGALVDNATSGTDNAGGGTAWATQHLTLTADASIGGASRFDIRDSAVGANDATINGNGHNLTLVGTNQIWLVGAQVSNLNSININSGGIGLQDSTFTNTGGGNTTINCNTGGTVGLWSDFATGQTITMNWNFNGATTLSNGNDPATLNGPMTINGTSTWSASVPLTVNSNMTGTGVIDITGAGAISLTGSNSVGGLTIGAGATTITGNTTVGQLLGSATSTLNVNGAKLTATAQNHATVTLTSLSIAGGGTLDIGNGALVIPYTTSDPANTILGYLESAYDKGAWDKAGLTSSATSAKGTTLGYLDSGTQFEVKYTWYGDLDFSGTVTAADLTAMNAGNGTSWAQGDLNFDGKKNADDWSLFMLGDAVQNGSIPAGVPEPSSVLLALALPFMGGLRRRTRRA
ncbi:MAG TPA: autotransporter-associated beta strand repeat-containing protein [Tepidisphaeraceae bacterium]